MKIEFSQKCEKIVKILTKTACFIKMRFLTKMIRKNYGDRKLYYLLFVT